MAPNQSPLIYENDDIELLTVYEKQGYRTCPIFYVNGKRVPEKLASQARSNQTLLSFLREVMRLTGSKLGCAEGGCGACTVMVSKKLKDGSIKHYSANACLMPVLAADGCHITTVEGVGTVKGGMHPIQQAMVDMHGSQCGFCTPGIIVSIYTLFANNPTIPYLEEHLDGNLCRCTGYRPIWDAARSLCDDAQDCGSSSCGSCADCPNKDEKVAECGEEKEGDKICCSSSADKLGHYKETFLSNKSWINQPNEMFPKELVDPDSLESSELVKPLMIVDRIEFQAAGTWFKPTTLEQLLLLMKEFGDGPGCKIVVGNTEVGIETRFKHAVYPRLIYPAETIETLYGFEATESKLVVGACSSLSTIQHRCEVLAEDEKFTRTVQPIHDMLRWFASSQIRNVACLGGNLVTASPISDMNPVLACLDATLVLASLAGDKLGVTRRSVAVKDFFLRYRTVDLLPTELVERIEIPVMRDVFEYMNVYKQARRREDDISIVTSGMRVKLFPKGGKMFIEDISLAFGGMAPKTVMASATMKSMIGEEFCKETFDEACRSLLSEFALPEAVPGGQAAFRMTLTASFLYKFYLFATESLSADLERIKANPNLCPQLIEQPAAPTLDDCEKSGLFNFVTAKKPSTSGVQTYPAPKVAQGLEEKRLPVVNPEAAKESVVGEAAPHMSGQLHCTGEALYTDDIPLPPGSLHAALILSNQCGSVVQKIDKTPALRIPGVAGVYVYKDLKSLGGDNTMGPIVHDEVVFLPVGEKVRTVGQVLGVVIAETLESAELGARTVVVEYDEPKEKIIVTVEDAISHNSFYDFSRHTLERGDKAAIESLASIPDSGGKPAVGDIVKISGTFRSGAQEHFYLETNSTLVIPSESDTNLTVYCSTQAPTKTQTFVASSTGTPASKVVVRMKRMGGGFGGKETRSVFASCAAAVAAKISGRPVRLTLSRDVDMSITGTRHVFVSKYHASAVMTESGPQLQALDIKLFANAGCGFDLSGPVVDRALFHVDGCYYFPNFRAVGVACKTVQAPHTAFRGFGGPQGMVACEHVIDHLAVACGVSADQLRRTNMYKPSHVTPFGMIIGEKFSGKWNVPTMWDRLYSELGVEQRRKDIDAFNAKNKWLKRGLSLVPTKFGIAFTAKYMNQGGALVHVYTDGTVLVSHGGTEMGQGLHTKVCQVAAQAFGIPLSDVYVNDSSTDKVANTIPTAASMSTDTYGMATLDACRQILARLQPIREKLGAAATFREVAHTAFMSRVDLSAHGFFALDDSRCGFDWLKEKPDDFPPDAPDNSWKGHPFNYFTQGVACAEVEVDVLTGSHRTVRVDVIVDVGSSINPAIDIGQIEGAFVQGMGWSTTEEVIYSDDDHKWIRPTGKLFTTGPGTYKIPAFNDVPETFNVTLLENVDNPFAVHSSKAIGEPPFFMGTSVYYAIKDAVRAARIENLGQDAYFEMRLPATSERIRMQCADAVADKAVSSVRGEGSSVAAFQPQGSY